ncbi:glycosyltransferase family 2 protein [uncultured Polaribacter sp.]|uniref:glycosyltransferase family 2 protein n=1 Tax=uncultured Polaribacter sp. TaxID=174711 RepID=UPI00261E074B|nr:glycosyltransferase family 2 protein [uncultured Polaribacter sp.]
MKKLSIIIPHFNSKIELKKMLSSIPNEAYIEVLVIDDNSNFDIFSLKTEFTHVSFFRLPKHLKGAGAARNLGLKNYTGNFLMFADSDDFFIDGAFDTIKHYLDLNYDMVYFTPTSFNFQNNKIGNRHKSYSLLIEEFLKNKNKEILYKFYVPWSKLIARRVQEKYSLKFDEVIASNDVNFSLKSIFYSTSVFCTTENIYCVTESDNSLTKQVSEEVLDSRFEAISRYNDFLKSKKLHSLQGAMSGHLWNTRHFGVYKFLYRFFYCKYKKYPIFYDFKHILRALRHFK